MKFIDQVKVQLRSGSGGNGCASFRREKFIPHGGPNGGDGGRGGDILVQGSKGKSTLLDFQYQQHIRAPNGAAGMGKDQHGKNGDPAVLELPLGTVLSNTETGEVLLEVVDEEPQLCLRGGLGGKGNARFKTSTNRAPMNAEEGRPGVELWVTLELKLMADVGLAGFPNAGKSTLISRISHARPKVADYPFTTLVPNLGVVPSEGFESFVVADIPGIIRGAHAGAGLGLRFLRHIERTAMLLLMLDISGMAENEPMDEYRILLEEMAAFSPALPKKPRAVALTKVDAAAEPAELERIKAELEAEGERVFAISAVSGHGLEDLLTYLGREVFALRRDGANQPEHEPSSTPHRSAPPDGR